MENAPGLTTRDVINRTGLTARQLNHWDQLGIVGPSAQPALGSGTRRLYSRNDVFLLLVAGALRAANAPLELVSEAISHIRIVGLNLTCPDPTYLVASPRTVTYLGHDEKRALAAASTAPAAYILNLAMHARRAAEQTADVPQPSTALIRIDGRAVQCTVAPESAGFVARCKAYADSLGRGATADEAVAALQSAIQQASPGAAAPISRRTDLARSHHDGASSWGGDW